MNILAFEIKIPLAVDVHLTDDTLTAHSGEVGRLFRMIPATDSRRKRPGIGAKRRWFFSMSQIMVFKSNGFSFFA